MNNLQVRATKILSLTCAMLLCGSMGVAQSTQTTPGASAPTTQVPGQPSTTGQGPVNGQTTGQTTGMDTAPMGTMNPGAQGKASTDKAFVNKALQGGMAEVQLGQLTLQKSNNEQIKQFAQKMIDDHTRMSEQMKPVAQQLGVSIPTKLAKKDTKAMNKLQGLSGTAYDQAYIQHMIKDHKTDLSEFQAEASNGQNPSVKDVASQGSQVISQHLQMIQQLAKDQNVTMSGQ